MRAASSNLKYLAALIVLVAAQAFILNYLGSHNYLPEGSDHWTEDWLIRYFSKRETEPNKDIVLVLIGPETLEKEGLGPSIPVDRGWMAKLITSIADAQPRAIGIDFYYANAIDPIKDNQLETALRDAKAPIVVAAVDDSYLATDNQRKFKKEFLEAIKRPAGHIYVKQSKETLLVGDKASRLIDHGPSKDGFPSLTSQLARTPGVVAAFGEPQIPDGPQRIDWLLPPTNGLTFDRIPAYKVAGSKDADAVHALKDKIVLIGPDFPGLDRHYVPFSVGNQTQFPGIFVHAQALAQILEGRFFFNWTSTEQFLLLFAVAFAGAIAGFAFHETYLGIALGFLGTLLIIALSVPFFMLRIPLPTALLIITWAGGISIGQHIRGWVKRLESAKPAFS